MNTLVLYDDQVARAFEPFALTRPASELRAATEIVRRRWEIALRAEASGFIGAGHLADFEELDAPSMIGGDIPAGTIIAQARCAVALSEADPAAAVWMCRGRVAAVRLTRAASFGQLREGLTTLESLVPPQATASDIDGWWIDEVWDVIRHLAEMLASDITQRV